MARGPIVFFDIGSTLIEGPDSGPARRLADLLGLARPDVAGLREYLFRTPLNGPDELAGELSVRFGVDRKCARDAADELWRAQLEEAYPLPGAREAIERLRVAGIERGYISNIWPPFYHRFEREFPDEAASQPVFVSFRTGLLKPDLAAFHSALAGRDPGQCAMVGDTYASDIAPALELGMRTVWVLHRPQKERRDLVRVLNGQARRADLTLASVGDLTPEQIAALIRGE